MSGTITDVRLRMIVQDSIGDALRSSLVLGTLYASGSWFDPSPNQHVWSQISGSFPPFDSPYGNLVKLEGNFQYLSTPADIPDLSPDNQDFTWVCIFNLDSLPPVEPGPLYRAWFPFIKDNSNGDDEYLLSIFSNPLLSIDFLINDQNTYPDVQYGGLLVTGTYYFVVTWYEAANQTINLQVNGGAVQSTFCSQPIAPTAPINTLDIGVDSGGGVSPSSNPNRYLNGKVRLYLFNRLLSSLEKRYLAGTKLYP